MHQTSNQSRAAEPQVDTIKLREVKVNLGNVFVRLAAGDRRKVLRLLEQLVYKKTGTTSYRDRWSKDDMRACYLKLRAISQKMANGFRRFASMLLKAGHNNCLAMKCLVDELVWRRWIEKP
jgi:replication-associated recombination protein RarA